MRDFGLDRERLTPRPNHDYTQDDLDREAELDRWLGRAIIVIGFFGVWKILELGYWLLTRLF